MQPALDSEGVRPWHALVRRTAARATSASTARRPSPTVGHCHATTAPASANVRERAMGGQPTHPPAATLRPPYRAVRIRIQSASVAAATREGHAALVNIELFPAPSCKSAPGYPPGWFPSVGANLSMLSAVHMRTITVRPNFLRPGIQHGFLRNATKVLLAWARRATGPPCSVSRIFRTRHLAFQRRRG